MKEQLALLPEYLGAHLRLTLAALLVGIAISLPIGVLVTRRRWLEQPVLGVASVIQTIPSLALLAVMVPLLAAAGVSSIGFLPAFLGLVLYSLLPILRNTVTGISGVDPAYIEAARGVGMTERQQLLRVELPLAMPVIIAGVRTSTVWTVGVATLSTPVGATSLGNYIFSGLQTRNYDAVFVGCVAAAALALTLDGVVRLLAAGLARRRRGALALALGALALLGIWTVAPLARGAGRADRVVVGSKTFTEQYVLSEILRGQIERRTGLPTDTAQSLGSSVVFDALRSGEIDAYVDYSGTIWATVMHREAAGAARADVLDEVGRYLREAHGVVLVGALGFENAYALAMPRARAAELGTRTVSDLARAAPRLAMGGDYEFFGRPEWRSLEAAYGLRPGSRRSMDASLMYQAAATGEVDVISAFSTDGRIAAADLVVLEDDKGAIPPYDAIVLASARLAERHPEAVAALRELVGTIDADAMRAMNMAVDRDHESPDAVARRFLDRAR
ncbi:MAG: ABC transporter permease subunit [Labilithrix sp.]|nr:ABC transporter permease subunit [Labilithrix sp.]